MGLAASPGAGPHSGTCQGDRAAGPRDPALTPPVCGCPPTAHGPGPSLALSAPASPQACVGHSPWAAVNDCPRALSGGADGLARVRGPWEGRQPAPRRSCAAHREPLHLRPRCQTPSATPGAGSPSGTLRGQACGWHRAGRSFSHLFTSSQTNPGSRSECRLWHFTERRGGGRFHGAAPVGSHGPRCAGPRGPSGGHVRTRRGSSPG